ncbi:hypothetical protein ENUP19_0163G0013 [Entamoeba nuttalli]|uniref:RasGEF domain containing protein n=2 Tax=Entamoeba nuttalli TaxID=412467 RepID=K2I0S4_ENTNP|nr:RasGEF domain containing protein [Entamoeba nuttalli P19]EKE42360.1 RasGEF domain containing protein [Entamoeba nuttalli P19]|eukprot:XP_008855309.1 RasGEF domain containing protein [Entamoeba nuttalli P19]
MKPSTTIDTQPALKKRSRRVTITKSLSKVLDVFEKSANSLLDRNSEGLTSNQIVFKVVDLTADSFEYAKLLQLFSENDFVLIRNENEVFSPDIRMTVWRMEKNRKIVFESLARKIKETNEQPKKLQFLTFERTKTLPTECEVFVSHVVSNIEEIFSVEGDPIFDDDGYIIQITTEKFFQQLFDPYASTEFIHIFAFTGNILCQPTYIVNQFKYIHNEYSNQLKNEEKYPKKYLENVQNRIESVIEIFLKYQIFILSNEEKIEINQMFTSPIYSSQFITNIKEILSNKTSGFKNPISTKSLFMKIEKKQTRRKKALSISSHPSSETPKEESRPKLTRTKSGDPLSIFESENAKVDFINVESFMNIDYKIIAEQLVVYDVNEFKKIPLNDLINSDGSEYFQSYIKVLNKLEDFFIKIMTTTEAFKYFIKVAQCCIDLYDLNMGHLIFSVIVKQSISCKEQFDGLKKGKKLMYSKIYDLFSIQRNLCRYRNAMKKIPFESPRVPIISIFLKDVISFKEMESFLNGNINYIKFRALTETIEAMAISQHIPYIIPPLNIIQNFLHSQMV